MKAEENQGFTSFDFFTLVLSMAIIVGISAPIIKKNFKADNSVELAKRDLDTIGQTIMNPATLNELARNYKSDESSNSPREIASIDGKPSQLVSELDLASFQKHLKNGEWEGEIGKDPWGRPYHFSFIRNTAGVHTHVAVWSDGPNQKNETSFHAQLAVTESPDSLSFKGDDVGKILSIR